MKKSITNTSKYLTTFLIAVLFAIIWYNEYNNIAYRSHRDIGFVGTVVGWIFVYLWICSIFRAFAIASSSVGDSVITQIICIGFADLVSFIFVCLLSRGWVTIIPGSLCFLCQVLIAGIFVSVTKKILMWQLVPDKTVLVYGKDYNKDNAAYFAERLLAKYKHMFEIVELVEADGQEVYKCIDENERVIFAGVGYEQRKEYANYCICKEKVFYYIPEIEEILFQNAMTKNLLDTPLKRYDYINRRTGYLAVKRVIDFVLAIIMLIITSPFMIIAAIAIKIEDGGPIFFRQVRVTKDEKRFNIIKLRSMVVDADSHGVMPTVDNDPRVTKVGAFCRKTRIDELPQLFNIIIGDMSFVGPRPERVEHVEMYEAKLPQFKYRHAVKGGLTGYAQVYGKYNTNPEDKLKLDLMYITNQSLYMDLRLFLLTIRTLFQNESTSGFSNEQADKINEET